MNCGAEIYTRSILCLRKLHEKTPFIKSKAQKLGLSIADYMRMNTLQPLDYIPTE